MSNEVYLKKLYLLHINMSRVLYKERFSILVSINEKEKKTQHRKLVQRWMRSMFFNVSNWKKKVHNRIFFDDTNIMSTYNTRHFGMLPS